MTKHPDGSITDDAGTTWDSAPNYLQGGVLGFCCCGDPDGNLAFVRDGLKHIDDLIQQAAVLRDEAWLTWHKEWVARGLLLFGTERLRDFFYYWADKEGLTEHGSVIPGWLTDKGRQVLAQIEALPKE